MSFPLEYLKSTLNINWAGAFRRILPSKRHLCSPGHTTRSREEVCQKLCLLDIFKYSINAEMAGNANNDSLKRSLTLTGDQVLITLWMTGISFHSTDLVLVAHNCVSSVYFNSCCWCKTEKERELSSGLFLLPFFSNCFVGTFFCLWFYVAAQGSWKRTSVTLNTARTPQRVYSLIKAIYIHNWLIKLYKY